MTSMVQHYKVDHSPEDVWTLVEDARRYLGRVMGGAPTRLPDAWPEFGSSAQHEVCVGPVRKPALTIVRHCEHARSLRMEIRGGWLGTLGLDVEVRPWGDGTFVTVQEYPLSPTGILSFVQSLPLMVLLRKRHRRLLLELDESHTTTARPKSS
ncbi:hypothetical protein [Streptomyces hundungensis]|uniref:hypothetical protein n=1 Tax=Streptomyces hundungensis TaxID=1077946 RepID=UPI0033D614D3